MSREARSPWDAIRSDLDAAQRLEPLVALPHLRSAAQQLAGLIDDTMAAAVLSEGATLRSAGASAGLSENAVGPRLARTRSLGAYANDAGRVTADGVRRAQYDREAGRPEPAATQREPLRFKPRRPT